MMVDSSNIENPLQEESQNLAKDESAPIAKEYEDLIHTTQLQIKKFKVEQDCLRSKLESVICENESLAEQLLSEMKSNSTAAELVQSVNKNVQQQLDAAIQERNSALEMWQTSLQLVTALENELKDYRDNSHLTSALEKVNEVRAEYSRAIGLLEDKLAAALSRLSKEKAAREMAEEKFKKLENDLLLQTELYKKRCTDLDEALISKHTALKKIEELEKSTLEAVSESKEAKLACSELESALERSLARLEEVLSKEAEAREKVDEALQIVEVALAERDSALQKYSEASDDAQQLHATINQLITEAGTEVQTEAEKIKEQYNNRIKTVLVDMRHLQSDNKAKNTQIQKLKSDLSFMESEVQRLKRELDSVIKDQPSLYALDRKLDGFFRTQGLTCSDSIRMDLELEQVRAEMIKLIQSNELEQRQFLLERHVLEEQINNLQSERSNFSQTNSELSARIDALSASVRQKDCEIALLKEALLTNSSPQHAFDGKGTNDVELKVTEQLRVWEEGNKMYNELQNQLENQRALANKWKSEVTLISTRFQSRLRELHSEVSALRKENREIHYQLQASRCQQPKFQPFQISASNTLPYSSG